MQLPGEELFNMDGYSSVVSRAVCGERIIYFAIMGDAYIIGMILLDKNGTAFYYI
jgi:hypothetical protein